MKIIFLDVDGVLNIHSPSYYSAYGMVNNPMERHLLIRLQNIIKETDAYIVLSSSWNLDSFKDKIKELNFKYQDRVLGSTQYFYEKGTVPEERLIIQQGTGDKFMNFRGDQIQYWIDNTKHNVEKYVVIEDEIFDVKDIIPKENIVEVNMNDGLSHQNYLDCIKILKGEKE